MQKLLYIGHDYQNLTKSSQFILDLIKEKYEITKIDFLPCDINFNAFDKIKGETFDVVILWQIMPKISELKQYINFKHIAFFPMYDNAPPLNDTIWYEYKDCNIINFSKTLHEECKKAGLSSYYIQYFPKPLEVTNFGDEKSVFLWQRIEKINPVIIEKLIGIENVNMLYHHQLSDPNNDLIQPSIVWKDKVNISTWFDTKDGMRTHLQKSAIYIAPREFEGIGMSFLEAMAMGRCVIAPDYPTMNEYIQDGYNGFLYNLKKPERINIDNIREIQKNAIEYIKQGYEQWKNNKHKILDWIIADVTTNRDLNLIIKNLQHVAIKKYKITYFKTRVTDTYKTFYLFGIPIYHRTIK